MKINEIKTPNDVLEFMQTNIKYGWIDINNNEHVGNMDNFRRLYRTSSVEETLYHGIGTCIEQVYLMKNLLDNINIPNKMFCTRVYEDENFSNLDIDVYMHCFLLYQEDGKLYQLEHPNGKRVGIHSFESEEQAILEISSHHQSTHNGSARIVTEFYEVQPNLSFKDFNNYINSFEEVKYKGK